MAGGALIELGIAVLCCEGDACVGDSGARRWGGVKTENGVEGGSFEAVGMGSPSISPKLTEDSS